MAAGQVSEHTWFFKTKLTYLRYIIKGLSCFQGNIFILINAYF